MSHRACQKFVNTNFSQLQKIKQLKRNRFAKINLYWCIMSTISILILLQKNTPWFYLRWIWLKQESSWFWLEDGLIGLHNKSLASSLLEIYCPSSSSSSSNVLQVLQGFFKVSWDGISPELRPLENFIFKMRRDVLYL